MFMNGSGTWYTLINTREKRTYGWRCGIVWSEWRAKGAQAQFKMLWYHVEWAWIYCIWRTSSTSVTVRLESLSHWSAMARKARTARKFESRNVLDLPMAFDQIWSPTWHQSAGVTIAYFLNPVPSFTRKKILYSCSVYSIECMCKILRSFSGNWQR